MLLHLLLSLWFATQIIAESTNFGLDSASSLTILFQNDLDWEHDEEKLSVLLLDPVPHDVAQTVCASHHESLLTRSLFRKHDAEMKAQIRYQVLQHGTPFVTLYLADAIVYYSATANVLRIGPLRSKQIRRPALCTQSATGLTATTSRAGPMNKVTVRSGSTSFTGYRNRKAFRFLGIPYAQPIGRWQYSSPSTASVAHFDATSYGPSCHQSKPGQHSENCLFLNIQTPRLPRIGDPSGLKPVLFFIHGGAYLSGSGSSGTIDGSNLSSREDIVVVTINYRLGAFGSLAIPGTEIKGNYGVSDQISALQWIAKNIAAFGGDPNKVTIVGQSAGAASVRNLLGSPLSRGLFHGAMAMSSPGGFRTAAPYSELLTPAEAFALIRPALMTSKCAVNVACLKRIAPEDIVSRMNEANKVVVDGHYITSSHLNVADRPGHGSVAHVPTIWGVMENDGIALTSWLGKPVKTVAESLRETLFLPPATANRIANSGLFPVPHTQDFMLDVLNVTQRVATDAGFRCINQATAWAGQRSKVFGPSWVYDMQRSMSSGHSILHISAPKTYKHPLGDPSLPYFKNHGAEILYFFGTWGEVEGLRYRDRNDLYATRLITDYVGSFVRTGNPNPSLAFLRARGHTETIQATLATPWAPVSATDVQGHTQRLDWPPRKGPFSDVAQCAFLGYPTDYYFRKPT